MDISIIEGENCMVTTREVEQLISLYQFFVEHQFVEGQRVILSLLRKKQNNSLHIAFCGHYSSGKSTFINCLFKENILPTSPIPTSGNIVQISKGENETIIYKSNGIVERYSGLMGQEQLQSLCKDSEDILKIELRMKDLSIDEGITLIDTPGIDSTEVMHALSTETIIPVVDVMYYIVDYNHVKSEVNLQFVKKIKERGKKVILVINQIDKHNEQELSFAEYKKEIIELWNEFGISEIYFISLKQFELKTNEWNDLKLNISKSIKNKNLFIQKNYNNEINHIATKFNDELLLEFGEINSTSIIQLELINIQNKLKDIEVKYTMDMDKLLNSVQLITYEIREQIKLYLEYRLPTFRISMFNKKKTVVEKETRLSKLYKLMLQQVKIQLDIPFKKIAYSVTQDEHIYEVGLIFNKKQIENLVREGVVISHQSLNLFANDLEYEIKMLYKKFYFEHFMKYKNNLRISLQESEVELTNQLEISKFIEGKQQQLRNILLGEVIQSNIIFDELLNIPYSITKTKIQKEEKKVLQQVKKLPYISNEDILSKSMEIEQLLKNYPLLTHMVNFIHEKRMRIEKKTFTVVLFGAFSAGKSSLINSLLGRRILPSSPNPTTSIITYIKASDKFNKDLTARIFDEMGERIVQIDELELIIANEELASCIKKVEIFFDCIWTKKGIIFIDTPGVNSINRRHTEVAFSFMKHADIIMYVSYYHHSFSKSDKEFLYQLGRVKESTLEDNMIFILNAIDLAEDENGIKIVQQYVVEQLQKSGITNPTIFGVSSKYFDKENNNHQYFIQYLDRVMVGRQLKQSMDSLQALLENLYNEINSLILKYETQQVSLELEKDKLEEQLNRDLECIHRFEIQNLFQEFTLECDELFFYMKKRLMGRFRDFFIDCFHPNLVKRKQDLKKCLQEFIYLSENNLIQEFLATTLRMEKNILDIVKREICLLQPDLHLDIDLQFVTPEITELVLPIQQFQSKKNFTNSKNFFEGNGREVMFNDYLQIYDETLDKLLNETNKFFQENYQNQLLTNWNKVSAIIINELISNYENKLHLYSVENITPIKQLQLKMGKILNS